MSNVIGKSLNNGYAGSYSRQPDQIIDTHIAAGAFNFGAALVYSSGNVVEFGATNVAADFVGVASREVKTTPNYTTGVGGYLSGDPVPVFKRGRILVKCQNGTPALNGDVYVRVALNASYPDAVIGGYEAASDTTNSVKLTNAKWRGPADANGIAELSILTQINA